MADLSDVEQAMVDAVTSILYPSGTSQASIVGALCRVYRGWPNSATLNADLNVDVVNITIDSDNESGRVTTRYLPRWQTTSVQPGTTASTVNQSITISGTPAVGDIVGAMIDGTAYAYRIQAGDAPDLIASNLGQMIQVTRIANVRGTTIIVPGSASITVRVVCDSPTFFESRRQEKELRVICWCPAPLIRDAVAAALDAALNQISFLSLPDSTQARIIYRNTASYDQAQNALLYRRDLAYTVEYCTISSFEQPSMLFGASGLNANIKYG